MNATTSPERAAIMRAGAEAARIGTPRSSNPHPRHGEDWINWMDGYDHQSVWLETRRGVYELFLDDPRLPTEDGSDWPV